MQKRYIITVIIASLGAAVSLFLAWSAMTGDEIAGCGEGSVFNCSHVLHSRFSKVWGVPVSVPGACTFLAILGCLLIGDGSGSKWERLRQEMLSMAVAVAAASALWFIGLQVFVLGKLCVFCMAVHTCSVTLAILTFVRPSQWRWLAPRVATALSVVALVAIVQWTSAEPQTYEITHESASESYEVLELDFAAGATSDTSLVARVP
jgi:uncharacterized membrane protein